MRAGTDRAWVRDVKQYPLGQLRAGDRIYFAVDLRMGCDRNLVLGFTSLGHRRRPTTDVRNRTLTLGWLLEINTVDLAGTRVHSKDPDLDIGAILKGHKRWIAACVALPHQRSIHEDLNVEIGCELVHIWRDFVPPTGKRSREVHDDIASLASGNGPGSAVGASAGVLC
jgi:hypothetical protein